jgi:hypothetical protein
MEGNVMALPSMHEKSKSAPDVMESPPPVVNPPEPKHIPRRPFLVAGPMGIQEWVYPTREG